MNELDKLKNWISENAPAVLEKMNSPASEREMEALQTEIGIKLPESFKSLLRFRNGDHGPFTAFFGDGYELLSCAQMLEEYQYLSKNREISNNDIRQFQEWKELAIDDRIDLKGPVKPHEFHPRWLPITNMNGDVLRFLDFDPAESGIPGQVIEVDLESRRWEVIATSFHDLIQRYWNDVSAGKYKVDEHNTIGLKEEFWEDTDSWEVPDWLQKISGEKLDNYEFNNEDWHLDLGNFPMTRNFLESEFPKEMVLNEWQDCVPSKIDPEYYDVSGYTDDGVFFIAFSKSEIFQEIAKKIEKRSKKIRRVKLKIRLEKRNDATDRKSHPKWRCWLEATGIEYIKPVWKFW